MSSMKDKQSEDVAQHQTEMAKLEQKLRESNLQIKCGGVCNAPGEQD